MLLPSLVLIALEQERDRDDAVSRFVEGKVPKFVRCEGCGFEYVYFVEGSAEGIDEDQLKARLKRTCALVPCMECGRYQADMVRLSRRLHRRWMWKAGLI